MKYTNRGQYDEKADKAKIIFSLRWPICWFYWKKREYHLSSELIGRYGNPLSVFSMIDPKNERNLLKIDPISVANQLKEDFSFWFCCCKAYIKIGNGKIIEVKYQDFLQKQKNSKI